MKKIIIGSRGSELALWQAAFVQNELLRIGISSEIEIIKTKGDQVQNLSFDKMEGKGFFTKEIEEALLAKKIDLAVHSHKDLETSETNGLTIAAVSYRESPNDILIIRKEAIDIREKFSLKKNAVVGTSSARRKSQLKHFRSDVQLKDLRGNVPTRIKKLEEGKFDAILLARAGVDRLNIDLSQFHVEILDERIFVPAPAQGVMALQVRKEDNELIHALEKINHAEVKTCIDTERKLLNLFEGGCQLPLGAICKNENGRYLFWAAAAGDIHSPIKRIYLESETTGGLPQKAKKILDTINKSRIFISRSEKQSEYFFRTLKQCGYSVSGSSMTKYEKVLFKGFPECEWIFFSSKNCVKYFFEQHPEIPPKVKIGSIGGATAEALKQRGIMPDYTGQSNDTAEIGKEFAGLAGNAKILFPQSTASYRTVQKQFPSQKNLIDMVVYDTIENEKAKIPDADVVVLTSPTNAMIYLRKKPAQPDQLFIAIGKSTAEVLHQSGIKNVIIPWNTSEIALADAVMSV
ncbi:MAG: hydroxymethylbilane synthase [Bacteroidota bacterium]